MDKVYSKHEPVTSPVLLVCSDFLQVLDKKPAQIVRTGFGKVPDRTTFTRYARQFIREVGAIFDTKNRSRTVFVTGTLPGSTNDAIAALSAYSGWLVQAVTNWFRDRFHGSTYFGVWEYQRRGALHLHACIHCPSEEAAVRLRQNWKRKWIELLDSVSKRSGVDLYGRADGSTWAQNRWICRTDAQQVEKSVGAYLGKYLSKGSVKHRSWCERPPVSWWFADKESRSQVRQARKEVGVTRLPLSTAIDLWEKLGSLLAELVPKSHYYVSAYNCQIKGLISLAHPVQASMMFDSLVSVLRLLGLENWDNVRSPLDIVDACTIIFDAVNIREPTQHRVCSAPS